MTAKFNTTPRLMVTVEHGNAIHLDFGNDGGTVGAQYFVERQSAKEVVERLEELTRRIREQYCPPAAKPVVLGMNISQVVDGGVLLTWNDKNRQTKFLILKESKPNEPLDAKHYADALRDFANNIYPPMPAGPDLGDGELLDSQVDGLMSGEGASEDHENVRKALHAIGFGPLAVNRIMLRLIDTHEALAELRKSEPWLKMFNPFAAYRPDAEPKRVPAVAPDSPMPALSERLCRLLSQYRTGMLSTAHDELCAFAKELRQLELMTYATAVVPEPVRCGPTEAQQKAAWAYVAATLAYARTFVRDDFDERVIDGAHVVALSHAKRG